MNRLCFYHPSTADLRQYGRTNLTFGSPSWQLVAIEAEPPVVVLVDVLTDRLNFATEIQPELAPRYCRGAETLYNYSDRSANGPPVFLWTFTAKFGQRQTQYRTRVSIYSNRNRRQRKEATNPGSLSFIAMLFVGLASFPSFVRRPSVHVCPSPTGPVSDTRQQPVRPISQPQVGGWSVEERVTSRGDRYAAEIGMRGITQAKWK